MQKTIWTIFFTLLFFSGFSQTGTLKMFITDIPSDKGTVKVVLYGENQKEFFLKDLKNIYAKKEIKASTKPVFVLFKDLPYGSYAAALFHDENNNGRIDRAKIGFPIEPYGFSGNKKVLFKPSYEDAEFQMNAPFLKMHVKMKTTF